MTFIDKLLYWTFRVIGYSLMACAGAALVSGLESIWHGFFMLVVVPSIGHHYVKASDKIIADCA